jgi:hypothetical protein
MTQLTSVFWFVARSTAKRACYHFKTASSHSSAGTARAQPNVSNSFSSCSHGRLAALRSLKLDVTEADLDVLGRMDEVCSCLFPTSIDGIEEFTRPGLQNLSIYASRAGVWPHPANFEAFFDLARKVVCTGVLRLTSLRTLTITLAASVKLPPRTANAFEEQLRDQMPWCSKVSVVVQPEKSPRAVWVGARMG